MPLEKRVLEALANGGMTAYELAAFLWPHWTTQRGHLTAAAEGRARAVLRRLAAAERVATAEETRGGRAIFVSVSSR
jgi:hypothetical protein